MSSPDPILDTNDPRLTAYVLGELAPTETAEIEAALQSSPELRAAVADIRRTTETISNVFITQPSLHLTPKQKSELLTEVETVTNFDVHSTAANVTPTVTGNFYRPTSGSSAPWLKIAIAAGLAGAMLSGAYYFSTTDRPTLAASDHPTEEVASLEGNLNVQNELSDYSFQSSKDAEDEFQIRIAEPLPTPLPTPPSAALIANPADENDAPNAAIFNAPEMSPSKPSKLAPLGEIAMAKKPKRLKTDFQTKDAFKAAPGQREFSMNETLETPDLLAEDSFALLEQDAAKQQPPLKLTPIALAQRSISQSALRSLNLKIIPQASSTTLERRSDQTLSPAIFKLQISDQDAKRIVGLLSRYVDPLQQRSLSFDDLIGFQKPASIAKYNAEMVVTGTSNTLGNPQPTLGKSQTQQASVAMLAVKLREVTRQSPLHRSRNEVPNKEDTIAGERNLTVDRALNDTDDAAPAMPRPGQRQAASLKTDGKSKFEPFAQPSGRVPATDKTADQQVRADDFHFDYTQVIQQLKANLELRNQSVLGSQR